jgi:hypothetical protein
MDGETQIDAMAMDDGMPDRVCSRFKICCRRGAGVFECFVGLKFISIQRSRTQRVPSGWALIAAELPKAVKNHDAGDLAAGIEGLSGIATKADVQLVVDAARRWPPFAAFAVGNLSTTCAPGAAKAAVTIRHFTTSARGRDWMDGEIHVTERVREGICGGASSHGVH